MGPGAMLRPAELEPAGPLFEDWARRLGHELGRGSRRRPARAIHPFLTPFSGFRVMPHGGLRRLGDRPHLPHYGAALIACRLRITDQRLLYTVLSEQTRLSRELDHSWRVIPICRNSQ